MSLEESPSSGEDTAINGLRAEITKIEKQIQALIIVKKVADKFKTETREKVISLIDANREYLEEVLNALGYKRDEDCNKVEPEPDSDSSEMSFSSADGGGTEIVHEVVDDSEERLRKMRALYDGNSHIAANMRMNRIADRTAGNETSPW